MDQSADFGAYIKMLVEIMVDKMNDVHMPKFAAAEILRHLDGSSKFSLNIQSNKWKSVQQATAS